MNMSKILFLRSSSSVVASQALLTVGKDIRPSWGLIQVWQLLFFYYLKLFWELLGYPFLQDWRVVWWAELGLVSISLEGGSLWAEGTRRGEDVLLLLDWQIISLAWCHFFVLLLFILELRKIYVFMVSFFVPRESSSLVKCSPTIWDWALVGQVPGVDVHVVL